MSSIQANPKVVVQAAAEAGIEGGESLVAFTLGFTSQQHTVAKAVLEGSKLTYFPVAARAETARLMLSLNGISFTDERINFSEWTALKPNTPWGSLPYLTLADGTVFGQSLAINRFIAKLVGLYPTDPALAARADELTDALADFFPMTMKVGVGLEQAEKAAARLEAAKSGPIAAALAKVDGFIGQHGVDGHAVGGELTVADLFLFSIGTAYVSGTFDGIPEDLFATYPNIEAVRRTVSTHPAVAAYYADRTDEGSQFHKKTVEALAGSD